MDKENKILRVKLKDVPQCMIELPEVFDFTEDWLQANAFIEEAKRKLFFQIKNELHEKIATLNLEDVLFEISKK